MFENNEVDIFEIKNGLIYVDLKGITIRTKDGSTVKNTSVLCRLLSMEEIIRINTTSNNAPLVHDTVEESVYNKCLIDFIGISKDDVDIFNSDAGLLSRVSSAVINTTLSIVEDPKRFVEQEETKVDFIDIASAIVSQRLNIPYHEVLRLPVNTVLKYFSVLKKIYPNELSLNNNNNED